MGFKSGASPDLGRLAQRSLAQSWDKSDVEIEGSVEGKAVPSPEYSSMSLNLNGGHDSTFQFI